MKTIKRIFSLLLAFVFAIVQVNPVNADDNTGSITINKAVVNETYKIYKILDLEKKLNDANFNLAIEKKSKNPLLR